MKLRFGSIVGFSKTDYPGKAAAVVLLAGCPLKCGYCYSAPLVNAAGYAEEETRFFVDFMRKNKESLGAVVFSGGEPCMQGNALAELCKQLSENGFKIKIDTNGYYPDSLHDLFPYVNYVAMDVKTKLDAAEYGRIAGFKGEPRILLSQVLRSLAFLEKARVLKEFRTTIIPGVNDFPDVILDVTEQVKFADVYALQQFQPKEGLLDKAFEQIEAPSKEKLLKLAAVAKHNVSKVVVRADGGEVEVL
ncbi:MAG: anaerobic ribonucleoside-triphosphate reductase activating protein [Candidatus Micrarchaeota archaeon]